MSTCAVMMVRDEADIIEVTVRHLLWHVDEVIVADNRSVDGTREILEGLPVDLRDDPEIGRWQDRKMTAMAMEALGRGHEWVLPCDADEIWHCGDRRERIGDWLAAVAADVSAVTGRMFLHIHSAADPEGENPIRCMGYRNVRCKKKKVACRLTPDLWINYGNHSAQTNEAALPTVRGLIVRHFPFRTEEQFVRKVRNRIEAHKAAGTISAHRRFRQEGRSDEEVRSYFRRKFFWEHPADDDHLVYDPAPAKVHADGPGSR